MLNFDIPAEESLGCHLCSYVASDHFHLYRHIEKHSKKTIYSCNKCSYQSNSRLLMKKHKKNNCNITKNHCPVCDFSTAHYGNLIRHIRNLHQDEKVIGEITTSIQVYQFSSIYVFMFKNYQHDFYFINLIVLYVFWFIMEYLYAIEI